MATGTEAAHRATADRSPNPEQVARILTVLDVGNDRYADIMTLVHGTDEPQWVATTLPEQRQQMSAFLDYEQNATAITEVAPLLIPGLLQTTDYIRTIMSTGGSVPQVDIPTRIAIRVGRREVITRQNPARLLALIGQAALCQDIGGKAVMAAQLRHLVEMARRPNVELRVVPFGVGWHPALDGSFALIDPDSPTSAVFLETRRTTLWLHKADDVRAYKSAVDTLLRTAMNLDDSIRFTAAMAERMESRE